MRIDANGHQVCFQLSGPENAATVCLSHSLACSGVMWEAQVPALGDRFRVLRYDTRGHGGSEATSPPYSLDRLADDVVAMLDALGIERVHWVGISMGGMIGQSLALRHPRRLLSLVLCDTLSVVSDEAQAIWADRIDIAKREGMAPLCGPTLERWFTPSYLEKDPPGLQSIRAQILNTPVTGYIGCCEAIRRIDYIDRLDDIRLPTRVIVGADDPATTPADAHAIHRGIEGSSLVTIDDAAHLSNVEQPEAFNNAVLEFLESR
ncbi:MAG TPA: 3-oxoadipate enol-lactonase [Gammaproteobacteria bacterium]|nr:3-oxoadipate enol-lactonase [Gammaproteobacteria bacterium]